MGVGSMTGETVSQERKMNIADLTPRELPTWCPGCGNFNILTALKTALIESNQDPDNTLIVSGIGCGSKLPHFVKTYGFEGLHGRALPVATGAHIANSDLTVIIVIGDGDCYGIGGNHFFHTMRRNFNLTLIAQNNGVYGLTKGQYSPTTMKGTISTSSPFGCIEEPVNPLAMGLACGATYIARGYAYESKHLVNLIADGIAHRGFSLIDVFQPCMSYNKVQTIQWYHQRVYKLEETDHNPKSREQAMAKAFEWGDTIPIGLFYKEEGKPTYLDSVPHAQTPLTTQDISNVDIKPFLERYK